MATKLTGHAIMAIVSRIPEDDEIEDRCGHFYVCECTKHGQYGEWYRTFNSYREATEFYRKITEMASHCGGLYPDVGVREVGEAELEVFKAMVELATLRGVTLARLV
jgi:hypothetical protein